MRDTRERISAELNRQALGAMEARLDWYCAQTAPQQEWKAHAALGELGIPAFLASKSRWRRENRYQKAKKRIRYALIPRLIFVGFPRGQERFREILVANIVQSLIGISGTPAALPGHALTGFLHRIGAEVEAPDVQQHMPTGREFAVGDAVRVIDGALEGHVVDVTAIRGPRAWVLAKMMLGAAQEIEIPTMRLEKINGAS